MDNFIHYYAYYTCLIIPKRTLHFALYLYKIDVSKEKERKKRVRITWTFHVAIAIVRHTAPRFSCCFIINNKKNMVKCVIQHIFRSFVTIYMFVLHFFFILRCLLFSSFFSFFLRLIYSLNTNAWVCGLWQCMAIFYIIYSNEMAVILLWDCVKRGAMWTHKINAGFCFFFLFSVRVCAADSLNFLLNYIEWMQEEGEET